MAGAPDPELLEVYRAEAVDTMGTVGAHLLRIEQGAPDRDVLLEDVLRLAHDIKGSARMVGYELVGRLAHALEACLMGWRGRGDVPAGSASLAFRAIDHIRDLSLHADDGALQQQAERLVLELRQLAAPASAEPSPAGRAPGPAPSGDGLQVSVAPVTPPVTPGDPPATPTAASTLVRVRRSQLEAVSEASSQTLQDALNANACLRVLERALEEACDISLLPDDARPADLRRARAALLDRRTRARAARLRLADALRQLDSHAAELVNCTLGLRLAPAGSLLAQLERVARDTAAALGREVRVEVAGRDTAADMALIEALKGPLTHAVRNAVDHGLESPDERRAAGKPEAGLLRLVLAEQGERVLVEVADDGRGVDLAAARRKLGPRAQGLDDEHVLAALLRAGVSTREQVTAISGRGLGLGAAAAAADRLRGTATLSSQPGRGTCLRLLLPAQLALLEALLVRSGGVLFALPRADVLELLPPRAGVPSLAAALGLSAPVPAPDGHVLRLPGRVDEAEIAVDEVLPPLTLVSRPLPAHVGELPLAQGATVLDGGEPVLVLDARAVAEAARARAMRRILLVDDSLTVRRHLGAALEAAGFSVEQAEDGAAGLERLAAGTFDAVVSDVVMPRRDGFAVAEACLGRLPCVLATSAPSPEGAARAAALHATYLAKDAALVARVLAVLQEVLSPVPGAAP